jgi:peptide/nickel transport system substrate-binding protein
MKPNSKWLAVAALAASLVALAPAVSAQEPVKGGTLNVAITGEPPTLDAHHSTAFITQSVGWHIYEGLFTLDKNYNAVPMLAESFEFDQGRNTYVIKIRPNVSFHDGSILSADDVIASIERWGRKSNYGRLMYKNVVEVHKTGDLTIEIQLKEPSPVVPMMLAFPNQQAAIYPQSVIKEFGDNEIRSYIGTGPYRFAEHVPDKHIRLVRFDKYAALGAEPNGMAGKRVAYLDELRLIPTPEVSVRLEGAQTGLYDVADQVSQDMLPMVEMYPTIEANITKPYWWTMAVFNKKRAPFSDAKARQAFVLGVGNKEIMSAAFASEDFYRLDPGILFQEQAQWWTKADSGMYGKRDLDRAKALLKESGYDGKPIKWLTTREYDFMYKNALVATEQLKEVGFNIQLEVVDWATIVQQRNNPEAYDIFSGATTFTPDPGVWPCFDASWPGFWEDPVKDDLVRKMNAEMDQAERFKIWEKLQGHFWQQAPMAKFGDFFILGVKSTAVKNLDATPFPYYWNTWKE